MIDSSETSAPLILHAQLSMHNEKLLTTRASKNRTPKDLPRAALRRLLRLNQGDQIPDVLQLANLQCGKLHSKSLLDGQHKAKVADAVPLADIVCRQLGRYHQVRYIKQFAKYGCNFCVNLLDHHRVSLLLFRTLRSTMCPSITANGRIKRMLTAN